uniref:Uncharacterized protein n=1 Tax=Rhipicephalus zambeziensis TaxID=60191 RepID=A0A224Y640_9ACAR
MWSRKYILSLAFRTFDQRRRKLTLILTNEAVEQRNGEGHAAWLIAGKRLTTPPFLPPQEYSRSRREGAYSLLKPSGEGLCACGNVSFNGSSEIFYVSLGRCRLT